MDPSPTIPRVTAEPLIVTLLRHGEIEWPRNAFLGSSDPPLTALGREQMERAVAALGGPPLTAVATSPLTRCRTFATGFAAARGLALDVVPGLAEMGFGEWEGLTHAEVAERYPRQLAAFRADPTSERAPGGEHFEEFAARVHAAFDQWTRDRRGHALVIAHSGVLRALLIGWLGVPPPNMARFAMPFAATCRVSLPAGEPPCVLAVNFAAA